MNEVGTFLYIGEFIGCALFCVLYLLRSQWWTTPMGRNVLAMMFVLAVLQGLSLLRLVIARDWFAEHQVVIRFWSFLALFLVVWWRVIILLKVQHQDNVEAQRARDALEEDLPERDGDNTDPEFDSIR